MSLISGRPALDRLRPGVVELSLALLLFAAGALEAWFDDVPGPGAAQVVAVVLTTVPLAWRTVLPVTTVAVTTGGLAAAAIIGLPFGELLIPGFAPLLAVYSVGVQSTARGLVTAALIGLAAFATAVSADPDARLSHLLLSAGAMLAALAVGRAVRVMGFETDTLEARAAQLEREREALLAVERTGRDAVTEMRRLLGFLRPDDDGAAPTEPLPTLKRLDDLVVEVRRAGLDVELHIEGDLDDLSAGRALAAFRIVQEAFTNALRHAPGAHVRAALCSTRGELRIEVVDDGSGRAPASPDRGGYGLIGMRERVTLYGGTLEAGPRPDLGFAVVARLPTADP